MASDDQVMSQADIDALLSQVSFTPSADADESPAAPAKPPEPPKAKAAAPPPPKNAAPPPPPVKTPEPPKAQKLPPPPAKAAVPPPSPSKIPAPPRAQKAPPPAPKAAAPKTPEPPRAQKAPAPKSTVPTIPVRSAPSQVSSSEISSLKNTVADLSRQVGKLANIMQHISELDDRVTQLESSGGISPDIIQALNDRIGEMYYLMETMRAGNADSDIQTRYICTRCHSRKLVALHVKCTNCGNENWMGWWPKTNK